ncbi:MAG TPA: CpsD/CapB family tyrosine-protein kinase [Candidatus Omnitrophota bacterium]|nr:CpsD/CapB family tyrosine-protein kinase [Candidatus Omnitrophota bacterium]HRZ15634.1 CpsD/CapB family tyrosine-protein kinase [Candidatus Omnitrophota bacterium]
MGKITDALKKATEERMTRLEKLDSRDEVKYQFIAQKTVDSKIDPRIVAFYEPASPVAEQYRILRTNILALGTNKILKTVAVTSSIHSEGKTISCINFAISMAQDLNKKKILLIDADMRRGRIKSYLGINTELGLSDLLADKTTTEEEFISIGGIENLTVLPCGKYPNNPAELLGSMKFRNLLSLLKERYDFIIIDCPPIIPVTDANIIGPLTDGVVMAVQAGRTQRGVVKNSEAILKQANTKLLGYIITNVQYHIPAYIYRYL